jgi:hypothetical protein
MTTMKCITTALALAVCALLSNARVAASTGSYTTAASLSIQHQQKTQQIDASHYHRDVQGSDEYEPWPNGTPVAWEFPDEGWWTGTVTKYNDDNGLYTIKWEDGSVDYFDDIDQIDQMVAYANQGIGGPGSTTGTNADNSGSNGSSSGTTANSGTGTTGSTGSGSTTGSSATTAPASTTYPVGTPVSVYEEGRWWDGTITAYSNGYYTVKWQSDNEFEKVQKGAVIDKMVVDGQDDDEVSTGNGNVAAAPSSAPAATSQPLWEVGTPVASFEENQWWKGHITKFSNNVYTVKWNSGEVETYTDFDEVNQMVSDAETIGHSSSVPQSTSAPSVVPPVDDDDADDDAADDDVADSDKPYPQGTVVYMEFEDDGWWVGTLVHYRDGMYTIRWSDGSHDVFVEGYRVDEIVANAKYIPDDDSLILAGPGDVGSTEDEIQQKEQQQTQEQTGVDESGMSTAGKAFLSVFVSALGAVGILFAVRVHGKRTRARRELAQSAMEEPSDDVVAYRDEPEDDVPRII